jgi:hypothetical protein
MNEKAFLTKWMLSRLVKDDRVKLPVPNYLLRMGRQLYEIKIRRNDFSKINIKKRAVSSN